MSYKVHETRSPEALQLIGGSIKTLKEVSHFCIRCCGVVTFLNKNQKKNHVVGGGGEGGKGRLG